MLNTAAWKKLPTDLLTDEDIFYVEKQLAPEYAFAPYMYYITALRKADENGVFDLDDGIIFAQLMRVKEVSVVFEITNLFMKRKIIYRIGKSSFCGFRAWEYNAKDTPRTIEQRRAYVLKQIEEQEKNKAVTADFPTDPTRPDETTACEQTEELATTAPKSSGSNAQEMAQGADFFCPENDKKQENVVKNILDDKNQKNVVKGENTERKKDVRTERTETHTQDEKENLDKSEKEQFCSAGPFDSPATQNCDEKQQPWADKDLQDNSQNLKTQRESDIRDPSELAALALQEANKDVEKNEGPDVTGYLNEFFAKNCYGYKASQAAAAIKTLNAKILEVSDDVNTPEAVAGVICSEFKRMHEGKRNPYWKDIALLPSEMIKPHAWQCLMQYAGKILAAKQADNQFIRAEMQAQKEAEADREAVYDESEAELLKYNISPDDPARIAKLLAAKAKEQREAREPGNAEEDGENVGDIF